ncbi:hypothetical protein [Brasilonema sp. UFV-L1]|uniref:hypothetical protein n=1 Tax=Brasilonema sp. UFV-L1 TaxID=2234130 RepID=UPI00145FA3CD|nr:hypothetical protein [Brasilonema sp. UFV-L1]
MTKKVVTSLVSSVASNITEHPHIKQGEASSIIFALNHVLDFLREAIAMHNTSMASTVDTTEDAISVKGVYRGMGSMKEGYAIAVVSKRKTRKNQDESKDDKKGNSVSCNKSKDYQIDVKPDLQLIVLSVQSLL